jgi:hypothetical protein
MRRNPVGPPGDSRFRPGRGGNVERTDADAVDSRIDELTRELADAINEAEAEGRLVRRDYAIDVLRDSVPTDVPEPPAGTEGGAARPPLNPFALGIPLVLMGVVLTFIFTPVGVALLLLGALTCFIGLLMAIVRSTRDRFRARSDAQ